MPTEPRPPAGKLQLPPGRRCRTVKVSLTGQLADRLDAARERYGLGRSEVVRAALARAFAADDAAAEAVAARAAGRFGSPPETPGTWPRSPVQ